MPLLMALITALNTLNFHAASTILEEMTPGSVSGSSKKEILLSHTLQIVLHSSPTEHSEAMNILNLFLKGDGKGFDLETGDPSEVAYYEALPLAPRLETLKVTDAMRFILNYDTPNREKVFTALLKSRVRRCGLTELLWAIKLNSHSLVKLVLENLSEHVLLKVIGTVAIEAALSQETIHFKIISTLVENTHCALPARWAGMYSSSFVPEGLDSPSDRRQIRKILALSLMDEKVFSHKSYYQMLVTAFTFNDEPIFKLLARQIPTSFLELQAELSEEESLIASHSPELIRLKEIFEKVILYNKRYRKQKMNRRWMEAVDAMREQEIEAARITSQLATLIKAQTEGLATDPSEAIDTYPLAGKEIVVTRSDLVRESLTYLAAKILIGE